MTYRHMQKGAADLVACGAQLLEEDHGEGKGGVIHIGVCTCTQHSYS